MRRLVTIYLPVRLVGEPKKTKKEKKKDQNSGKLAIRPDHPRRQIKIKLCMADGLACAVIYFKCQPVLWGSKMALPITFASGLYNSVYYRTSRDEVGEDTFVCVCMCLCI